MTWNGHYFTGRGYLRITWWISGGVWCGAYLLPVHANQVSLVVGGASGRGVAPLGLLLGSAPDSRQLFFLQYLHQRLLNSLTNQHLQHGGNLLVEVKQLRGDKKIKIYFNAIISVTIQRSRNFDFFKFNICVLLFIFTLMTI